MTRNELARLLDQPFGWLLREVIDRLWRVPDAQGEAEDILRDSIAMIMSRSERFKDSCNKQVIEYLKTTARRKAKDLNNLDYMKRRTRLPSADSEDDEYDSQRIYQSDRLSHGAEFLDMRVDVRRAKARLDWTQRRIADLYSEGFSIREIADRTGIKRTTIHRWWHNEIAPRLRRDLAAYGDCLPYLLRKEREGSWERSA